MVFKFMLGKSVITQNPLVYEKYYMATKVFELLLTKEKVRLTN